MFSVPQTSVPWGLATPEPLQQGAPRTKGCPSGVQQVPLWQTLRPPQVSASLSGLCRQVLSTQSSAVQGLPSSQSAGDVQQPGMGWRTHAEPSQVAVLHAAVVEQVPQEPPQPSEPHCLPEHRGTQQSTGSLQLLQTVPVLPRQVALFAAGVQQWAFAPPVQTDPEPQHPVPHGVVPEAQAQSRRPLPPLGTQAPEQHSPFFRQTKPPPRHRCAASAPPRPSRPSATPTNPPRTERRETDPSANPFARPSNRFPSIGALPLLTFDYWTIPCPAPGRPGRPATKGFSLTDCAMIVPHFPWICKSGRKTMRRLIDGSRTLGRHGAGIGASDRIMNR